MRIGLYGDSTQTGVMVYGSAASVAEFPPSAICQMMLDLKYGPGVHQVRNYGVPGSTLWQAMSTALYGARNLAQHIAFAGDDIVGMNFGINDAYVPGYTAQAHKSNYAAMKQTVEASGKIFFYEGPNPLNMPHNAMLASLDAAVKTIPGVKVMDTFGQVLNYYPKWQSHLSDGVHPNAIMYWWIGNYLFKMVETLLPQT